MNNKRLLILIDLYDDYLEKTYHENKDLSNKSYSYQEDYLNRDGFGWSGVWIEPLKRHDIEVMQSFYTNQFMQKQWAVENNIVFKNHKENILDKQIEYFKPDLLLIETVRDFDNKWISKIKKNHKNIKKVFGHLCNPFYDPKNLKEYDLIFCCMNWMTKELNDLGIRTKYMPNAFNSNWISRNSIIKERNGICFYGGFLPNKIHDSRTQLIKKVLDEGVDIDIFSKPIKSSPNKTMLNNLKRLPLFVNLFFKDPIIFLSRFYNKLKNILFINAQVDSSVFFAQKIRKQSLPSLFGLELYKNCLQKYEVVLNVHGEVTKNELANMRVFEATGGGACLLTDAKDNIHEFFEEGKEVLVYKNLDDCIKKIQWAAKNPEEVKKIAIAGQRKTLNEHTYFHRSQIIINAIKD